MTLCFSLKITNPANKEMNTLNMRMVLIVAGLVPERIACLSANMINTFPKALKAPPANAHIKIFFASLPVKHRLEIPLVREITTTHVIQIPMCSMKKIQVSLHLAREIRTSLVPNIKLPIKAKK